MGLYDRHYYYDDQLQPLQTGWNARSIVAIIIVINGAIQLLTLFFGRNDQLASLLWLRAEDLGNPIQWYRFLTYGFVHSQDIQHVFFNMLSLFFLGQAVEQKYGRKEFLRIYLVAIAVCGVAWAVLHLTQRDTNSVLLGASGAVTAVSMLFVFCYPNSTLHIWGVLPVKAWVIGILIVGGNLMGNSQISANGRDQVAYDVHLIGAALAAVYFFTKINFVDLTEQVQSKLQFLGRRKTKLRVHRPESSGEPVPSKNQAEADRILDKIHRQGQDSLTVKEREFLENYSRQLRKARGRSS